MVTNLMASTPSVRSGLDVSSWLTRNQVADMLGVSVQTILNWESKGYLHPRMRPGTSAERGRQVHVYDPHEVASLPQRAKRRAARADDVHEISARAFELFDRGASMRHVVVKLRKAPEEVERLHEQWRDLGGADSVITPEAHAELARWFGPFASVAELCERVHAMLAVELEATVPDDMTDEEIERVLLETIDQPLPARAAPVPENENDATNDPAATNEPTNERKDP
jgi:hypothetical protein